MNWKAYEEVHFNANLIYRWVREGDEYVNRMTKEQMEALKKELALRYDVLRELTDEEILEIWRENERVYPMDRSRLLDRTRACIKKASEK
jgi:succinate dehydrogenase flavin-adding protein (antitoxin of CptAB toxin-antitoxin module)